MFCLLVELISSDVGLPTSYCNSSDGLKTVLISLCSICFPNKWLQAKMSLSYLVFAEGVFVTQMHGGQC